MIKNVKLKVETDEENQYVFNKLVEVNKEFAWLVYLNLGYDYYCSQDFDFVRAVCSEWKGFRNLVIESNGDLILFVHEKYYNKRKEKEITFEEFKELEEKQ